MSVVDLHPEDLLDKDARGALSADERGRLEAHLARCSACRAERMLRLDFADELEGEDRTSELLSLVQGALAAPMMPLAPTASVASVASVDTKAAEPSAPEPAPAPSPEATPELADVAAVRRIGRRPRRTAVVLLVAAAVMAAGAASATGLTSRVWLGLRGASQDATHTSTEPSPVVAPLARPAALVVDAPPAPVADAPPAPVADAPLEPALVADETPAALVVPAPLAKPAPLSLTAAVVRPPTPAPALAAASASASSSMPASASALFDSANAARRSGDTTTALARYDALGAQFPASPEARVAKATTAKLLLDRGDAAGALARFDAYLASGSSELREEAMAGRATALERLGRDVEEARAWAALLSTYPGTPYASHARSRVGRTARP